MRTQNLLVPGALGHSLSARLEEPDDTPRAHALFAHCFSGSKELKGVRRICRALVDEGIAVLTFDFTGLGESAGDFAETSFTSNVGDVVAVAESLGSRGHAPDILIGHSLGGAAVLGAAHQIPSARAIATIGAPSDPEHLIVTLGETADAAQTHGVVDVRLGGRQLKIRREFLDDLRANDLTDRIASLGRALLVFHSPEDEVVPVDEARRLYTAARHPKSFVSVDGADHLLQRDPRDADFVARVLAAWASRYVVGPGDAHG